MFLRPRRAHSDPIPPSGDVRLQPERDGRVAGLSPQLVESRPR